MWRIVDTHGNVISKEYVKKEDAKKHPGGYQGFFYFIRDELENKVYFIERKRKGKWVRIPSEWLLRVPFNENRRKHNHTRMRVSKQRYRERNPLGSKKFGYLKYQIDKEE